MNPVDTPSAPEAPPPAQTPGQRLRAAREAKGMHLGVLSVALKVPIRQLEALERDDYAAFKGVTFLRALAQSVCRHLGVDPVPVLSGLPASASPLASPDPTLQRFVPGAAVVRSSGRAGGGLPRPVLAVAALMLAGTLALIWWPEPTPAHDDASDAVQAAVPMGQASDMTDLTALPAPAASQASTPSSSPVAAASAVPVASAPASTAPKSGSAAALPVVASAVSAAPSASAQMPVAVASATVAGAQSALLLRVREDAWIEVRDGKGQMLIKRLVKAGETLKQEAQAPLFVYLGRADSTELLWQGKAVDLRPHTQNNEARIQIKP
jgi:cytoskeleton protein RodZ